MKSKGYLWFVTAVAALGGLLFGYDTAVISGTVKYLGINFVDPLGLGETAANALLGFAVSSALIGCVAGGLAGGYFASRFGRRRSLIIAAILFVASAVGSAYPETLGNGESTSDFLPWFIFYRILGGIGVGLASMLSPLYIAEMAPADKRGKMVSINQLAIITGIIVVYFVNYTIALGNSERWLTETGWRMMFLSEVIPASLLLVLVCFIPESPRWLVMRGRDADAVRVVEKVAGAEAAATEIPEIKQSLASPQGRNGKLFSFGVAVLAVGITIAVFQQFVGINVIMYYAPDIFRNMGMETDGALGQTVIVGIVNMIFTIIAIFAVDRFGRKPLMIIGSVLMAVSMLTLGTLFWRQSMGAGAFAAMFCYVGAFSMSWGPVCWVLLSEIFPNAIRSRAMAIAVAAQWIANYLVSWTFPILDRSTALSTTFHGGFAYWIYGSMAILSAIFIWRFVPETKGLTLEQMNGLFKKKTEK